MMVMSSVRIMTFQRFGSCVRITTNLGRDWCIPKVRVVMIDWNFIKDALYNVDPHSGASDDYAQGLVTGVVTTLMAATGLKYDHVIHLVADRLPRSFSLDRIPRAFRKDIAGYLQSLGD